MCEAGWGQKNLMTSVPGGHLSQDSNRDVTMLLTFSHFVLML